MACFPVLPVAHAVDNGVDKHVRRFARGWQVVFFWPRTGGATLIRASDIDRLRAAWLAFWRAPLGAPPRRGDALAWAAVGLVAGIFLHFSLLASWGVPWWTMALLALAGILAWWRWRAGWWLWPFVLLAAGAALAGGRIAMQHTPLLPANVGGVEVRGVVERVEPRRPGRVRLWLKVLEISRVRQRYWPARVRLEVRGLKRGDVAAFVALPLPGDVVRLRARLLRLPLPVEPGAYDAARELYMAGIGAVGFASVKSLRVEAGGCGGCGMGLWLARQVAQVRRALARQVAQVRRALARGVAARMDDGEAAALALALSIGARGTLAPQVREALREAGLAHILAISGLHLALLAGAVFWLVRGGLALHPSWALRWPLKKIAALAAWLVALGYLLLSGNSVATQRAFIMLSVALLAVLAERPAISMRNLGIAALIILAFWPHKALSAGFQMSFLAVMGLVAAYEGLNWWRHRHGWPAAARHGGLAWRAGLAMMLGAGGLVLTTVVASTFTALPVAWHFNRFATHGMLGNLAALPVLSLLVLPAALAVLGLLPLVGLLWALGAGAAAEMLLAGPMWLVEQGLAVMLAASRGIAALPGGWWHVPQLSVSGALLLVAGLLWLALRNDRLRLLGLLPVLLVAGGMVEAHAPRPDVLVEDRARLVAARLADGGRLLSATPGRTGNFPLRIWLRRDGDATRPVRARKRAGWSCDALMCQAVHAASGVRIVYLRDVFRHGGGKQGKGGMTRRQRQAVLERMRTACERADVVVAAFPLRGLCRTAADAGEVGPRLVIDRFDVWRGGAQALWLGGEGDIERRTARQVLAGLPWAVPPLARHEVMRQRRECARMHGMLSGKCSGT